MTDGLGLADAGMAVVEENWPGSEHVDVQAGRTTVDTRNAMTRVLLGGAAD